MKKVTLFLCGFLAFVLSSFNTNAQSVTIEKTTVSGCYYYSGASKTTISVQVGWVGATSSDLITVSLDGGASTRTIKPQSYYDPGSGSVVAGPIVTPQVIAFEINSDASSHTLVAVMTGSHSATSTIVSVMAPSPCAPLACNGTNLGGVTYYDNNANGVHDAGEIKNIPNITVTAFDKNGVVYNTVSDAGGRYAFNTIPVASYPVRVEFTNWPSNVQNYSGPSVTNNASSVQFVAAPSCSIDCGAVDPTAYSQSNPMVFTNLMTNGDPLAGGSAGTTASIIAHRYMDGADLSQTTIATSAQTGSLWAHAWNKQHKKLFSAAFLKRHAGLGPLGLGGIYAVDYSNSASPVVTGFLDVTSIGINVGQSSVPSNAARGLKANKETPNTDAAAFSLIGKVGIGGMDLSEDGNTLYFVNLFDKKVYAIDITNYLLTGTTPSAGDVTSYAIPTPGCAGGVSRPFALKLFEGKLYAGTVCDGSTGTKSNLVGTIYALNLSTNAWSTIFDFPLTYPKGYPYSGFPNVTGFEPWTDDMNVTWNGGHNTYPTPILSDIEFDLDGTMAIALMDRTAHQVGNFNYDNPTNPTGTSGENFAGGDILRAYYSDGAYVLENNAKSGPVTGSSPNNNQGPGFGEFYEDNLNITGSAGVHSEMGTGGLLIRPGSGEVMTGMVDPSAYKTGALRANGVRRLSNTTGKTLDGKSYYSQYNYNSHSNAFTSSPSTFSKGNGMGDLELAADVLSFLEIGNYVWNDADADGIQDPTEKGIAGMVMSLFNKTTGALIARDTTDANGFYYFSTLKGDNISANTDYSVVAGVGQYNGTTKVFNVLGKDYAITLTETGEGANPTLNDNNFSSTNLSSALGALPANLPKFDVTTGSIGYVNHTIDLGLTYGTIGNYVWFDTNKDGLQNEPASKGINGVAVQLLKDDGTGNYVVVQDTITKNDASGNPGYYNFQIALSGNYKVQFPVILNSRDSLTTQTATAATDGNSDANVSTGLSPVVVMDVLGSGVAKNNPTIDAGYYTPVGSLGNYVWYDDNNDGLQNEPASNGINGIKIYLYTETTPGTYAKTDSTITANDGSGNPGYYNFPGLLAGNYKVKFPTAIGNYPISDSVNTTIKVDGNNDADKTTGFSEVVAINPLSTGLDKDNPTIDAGYKTNIGSLGNYVWFDTNSDGLQNEPVANGINGVKVYLYKETTPGTYTKIDSTVTANNGGNPGYYNFPNLGSANYKVQFPTNVGNYPITSTTIQTPKTDGNNDADGSTGFSGIVNINTSSNTPLDVNNPTIDAGYTTNIGSLGNYVWNDTNGDGLQNEPAANGINGVKVYLYKDDGTGNLVKVDSTVTANDGTGNPGYYNFPYLGSGNYQVEFPTTVNNAVLTPTNQTAKTDGNSDANQTTGKSAIVTINTTSLNPLDVNNPTIDAGYQPVGSLGNYVWYDTNNDGLQNEPASNGINGVKVYLYKANGSGNFIKVDSTTTANNAGNPGYYNFPNLLAGNYIVKFPTAIGNYPIGDVTNQAPQVDGNNDVDKTTGYSGVVTITPTLSGLNKDNPTIDAGYKTNIGSLGNYVWTDTNGDGINNESTTNGINGVKVYLLKETTPNVFVKVDSTVTANNGGNPGYYNFPNLNSGNYKVEFPTSVYGAPLTLQTVTPKTDMNSDADATTGISPIATIITSSNNPLDVNNPTIDAGYKYAVAPYCNMTASIGVNQISQCVTNNQYQFTGNYTGGTGPYTYLWDFNDGTYGYTQNPTHVYATSGEHDVTLIVKDSRGCEAHASTVQIYIGAKPHASFDIYANSGNGTGITYSSTSTISGGWLNYNWDLGNGTTSTLVNPGPIYYAPGTYTVTLIATGNFGCSDTITKTIIVTNNGQFCIAPTASFTLNNATQCLAGNSFVFTNTSAGTSYTWNFGDATPVVTTTNPSHSYTAAGTYTITLTATTTCGSVISTKTVVVKDVPSQPSVTTGPTSVNTGNVIVLTNATSGGVWTSSNTSVATVSAYGVVAGINAGTATISYTFTNGCGSVSATSVITVTNPAVIVPVPPVCVSPVAAFTTNNSTQCLSGNSFVFTNTSTGTAPTYTWNFGDASPTVSTTNASHTYAAASVYTVSLTATNACGTNTATQTVTVNTVPAQPAAITGTTSVVVGTTTALASTTSGGTWSSSNTGVATIDASGIVTGVSAGTATISYTVTNSCGSVSATSVITVTNPVVIIVPPIPPVCVSPVAAFTINNATQCLSGNSFVFTNTSTGTAPAYTWNFGDGTSTIPSTDATHTYTSAATYTVTLTATNSCGTNSTTKTVTINTLPAQPAAISGSTSLVAGTTTTLACATSGGSWSSSNTGVATVDAAGIVTGTGSGTAIITYTVTNSCGSATKSVTITVTPACTTPVAAFTINNATQCLAGNSFVFTNATTGTVGSYTWNFGNGSSTATNPTNTYATAGTYTITLQASSACGGSSVTKTVTVIAAPSAPAAIGGTPTTPIGSTTTLTNTTSGGSWSSSNTGVATVNSVTGLVTGISAGSATITYTVSTACGSASSSILVTVTVPCSVASTSSTTTATICAGSSYTFNGASYGTTGTYIAHLTNSVGCDSAAALVLTVNPLPAQPAAISGATSVVVGATTPLASTTSGGVWSSANTGIATVDASGVVTGVNAGSVTISYTVTNLCGSTATSVTITVTPTVVVVPPPAPPAVICNVVASFTTNQIQQCVTDNNFVFTNTTTGGTAPYTYLWDLNDGTYASTKDVTKVYGNYGEHDVTLKVTDSKGCVSYAAIQQIYIGAKPSASFTVLDNTGAGQSKTFISSSTVALGPISYLWNLGDGTTSTLVNPTVTYAPGSYHVKLTVTGWGTCVDSAVQNIIQSPIVTLSVSPNPAINLIHVSFNAASSTQNTVKITNLQGAILQVQTIAPVATGSNVLATLNISGLANGTYFVNVYDAQNGFIGSRLIVKQ